MRNFSMHFYKNLIWIYLTVLICFSHSLFLKEIPDHIYISEEEEIACHFSIPVRLSEPNYRQETFYAEQSSYDAADYTVTCNLFGLFPIKEVEVTVIPAKYVYASGRVIGIYGQTSGVLVLDTSPIEAANGLNYEPAENKLFAGDYILAVNDLEINTKEELVEKINENGENALALTVNRKGEYIKVSVQAVPVQGDDYMLGIWVKDDMAGIGTMTYYTENGKFGALGHGIGDGETGQLLSMSAGSIYRTRLLGVTKGIKGTPGELEGIIYYGSSNHLGNIQGNDNLGIYGSLDEEDCLLYSSEDDCYEVGYKQEIDKSTAYILSDITGEVKSYEIKITDVDYQAEDSNKGIHFTVTDEELLELTGGIVQGMSGSPIIQNGKLIGAVTHVLVNDPGKGYGIFVETMMEHENDGFF